jgi:hypothetical protein
MTYLIGKTTYQNRLIKLIYFAVIKLVYIFALNQNLNLMKLLKETLTFTLGMLKFFFISIPVACMIFFTAHLFFEIKRVIHGK